MSARTFARSGAPGQLPNVLPPSRTVTVHAADGTRLHAEVFGPPHGYPIVLTHGFVCSIRAWAYQIADLATEYRVIAFDHRGHGQSGIPRGGAYTLNHLAADLDAVLEATLAPHERALLVGHSMGGMAIAAWSERYSDKVYRRADAVALINTATGDLLEKVNFLPVPRGLSSARLLAGRSLLTAFGGIPLANVLRIPTRYLVEMLAVGAEADRGVVNLVYELFAQTSSAGRGGCLTMLANELGARHLSLAGLTVPTLIIGSEHDRLTPISQSRRMARTAPHVVSFVELPGGHCSMLEQHREVNRQLRALAGSVAAPARVRRISS